MSLEELDQYSAELIGVKSAIKDFEASAKELRSKIIKIMEDLNIKKHKKTSFSAIFGLNTARLSKDFPEIHKSFMKEKTSQYFDEKSFKSNYADLYEKYKELKYNRLVVK